MEPAHYLRSVAGKSVWPVAVGGVHWSLSGAHPPDEESAIAVLHAALETGVRLVDTARAYTTLDHPSHNEDLIRRGLNSHPLGVEAIVVTKGGHFRRGPEDFPIDGRPEVLRGHVQDSLRHLGQDCLDLYLLHHPDPRVPLEESVGALDDLRMAGDLAAIGVSNVDLDQYERAQAVAPIAAVQNRLSLWDQADVSLAQAVADDDVAYLAYSPLGGPRRSGALSEAFPGLRHIAAMHGVTVPQVALAWILHLAPNIVPIVGARRPSTIMDSAAAVTLELTPSEVALIEAGRVR